MLGTHTAYVGFTGASGAVTSYQQISNFVFSNPVRPVLSVQAAGPGTLLLSWPEFATGYSLQQSSTMASGSWSPVSATVNLVNGQYQALVTAPSSPVFYRLHHP